MQVQLYGIPIRRDNPRAYTAVFVKRTWAAPWDYIPYLEALTADECAFPGIGTASLRFSYGLMKQPDAPSSALYFPLNIVGCYVMIVAYTQYAACPMFCGVVESEQRDVHSAPLWPQGTQVFQCLDFGHILDRMRVCNSYTDAEIGRAHV
jgi:hypothetical protein